MVTYVTDGSTNIQVMWTVNEWSCLGLVLLIRLSYAISNVHCVDCRCYLGFRELSLLRES